MPIFILQELSLLLNYLVFLLLFQIFFKLFNVRSIIFLCSLLTIVLIITFVFQPYYSIVMIFLHFTPSAVILIQTKKIFHASIFTLLQSIVLGISWFLSFDISMFFISNLPAIFILHSIIPILLLIFIKILDNRTQFFKSLSYTRKKYTLLSILILVGFFITSCARLLLLYTTIVEQLYSSIVFIFYTIITIFICFNIIVKNNQSDYLDVLTKSVESERDQLVFFEEFYHDYKGLLLSITRHVELYENELALELIKKEIGYLNHILPKNEMKTLQLVGILPIQGILMNYLNLFNEKALSIDFKINQNIDTLNMDIFDFSRCLNIILNNASESANSLIRIHFKKHTKGLTVTVTNDVINAETIDLKNITSRQYSTKSGGHRGNGLYILSKIVAKYNNVAYNIQIEKNLFILNFMVNYLK
ncbi:sensor histidine kinase [Listeria rocourtiae]|uniref:GHKL domain-containing protein n=1 Tax=Listeria rocourtiae TaxID=647910 RepID=UPI001623A0E9|nr:GHKL domain-containing protein [Listeria rocourtiae]MBC1605363.1 sensor histidine kinase [Listeria rocourtiae]